MKRPRDSFCTVQALSAVTVGLRGKGDGDRGAELQLARRLGRQRHDDERIVLGLLDDQAVVADVFQQARVLADAVQVEGHFRRAQTGIDLAERQKSF